MKYMGGKYFLSKEISELMKNNVPPETIDGYLEPFCGAINVLMRMNDSYNCEASDYHPDLIELWKEVQMNRFVCPSEITEQIYNDSKELESPSAIKGFIGFGMSFGGKFYSGYADKYKGKKTENFLQESINSLTKIRPKIKDIDFQCISYDKLTPHNKLIYCDPPYQLTKFPIKYRTGTKKYDIFDNEKFWEVMRLWSKDNYVFISETTAPEDFIPIWTKKTHRSASQSGKTRYKNESDTFKIEKVFVHTSVKERLA